MPLRVHFFVLLFFTLLIIFISWPFFLNLDSAFFDFLIWDPLSMSWVIAWNAHQLFKDPLNLFQTNIFYPEKNTLAYSENLLGITLLVLPIIKIFNNPVFVYNLALFLSFILSGYGMFLLVYHLTKNYPASILASLIFAFAPFKILQMTAHLNIVSSQWLPFVFLFLHKFFENKSFKNIILFSLFFVLQSLTSLHHFVFLLIGVLIFILVKIFLNYRILNKDFLKKIFISVSFIFIFLLPIFLPYFQLEKESKIEKIKEIAFYTPSLKDYFRPWYLFEREKLVDDFEHFVFIGFIPLILLIISLFILKKKENFIIYGLIALIGFLFSLGPLIKLNNYHLPGFYLPFVFLPGFSSIRAIGRFTILLIFGISIIIALGINSLFKKKILGKFLFFLFTILFIFEIFFISLNLIKLVNIQTGKNIPLVYQWLAKEKENFVILELPIVLSEKLPYLSSFDISSLYMYFSTYHWKKLVNGDSSYYPNSYLKIGFILKDFPNEKSVRLIKDLKVKYLILHYDLMTKEERERIKNEVPQWQNLVLKNVFENDWVYEIK